MGTVKTASPLAGAAVTVIGGDGSHVGSTTTDADGNYTLKVPGNATYLVKVTSGNIVMKAIHTVGTADTAINVNPGTTVTVAVLEMALGAVLDDGATYSTALSGVDVNAAVIQIAALPTYTAAANAAVAAVAANTDPTTAASTVTTTVSTITYVAVPAAPTGVSAAAGNGQVTVSWTAVAGADTYNVYYGTSTGVSAANGTKAISALANCTITSLSNGTAYYFVVTAVNAGGESAVSSEAIATPQTPIAGAPTGVTATAGNGQVAVSWTAVTGATSYNVYYKTSTGVTTANGTKSAGATSGSAITSLTNGTAYYFVVTAVNAGGESAVSGEVGATPQVSVAGAPTGVTATAGNGQVTVSWTAVTGAASYNVYYKTSTGVTVANGTKSAGATAGGAITSLTNGTAYYFAVTAVNAGGESVVSGEVSATPLVALMGGAVQNGGVALNNVSSASAVTVSTLAGSAGVIGSTDGTGAAARFNNPIGITTDGTNLYVADDTNRTIRKVVIATGVVTTVAGSAGSVGSTDGTGTTARFNMPSGLTTDGTNLYVADYHNQTIRKIVIATGAVTTLAGSAGVIGSTDGTGTAARFNYPLSITMDGTNLYVADDNNETVRKVVIATGAVTTVAGSAGLTGSTDGTGSAARFNLIRGITTDGTNLYVGDAGNHTIRKVVIATGVVTTLAGSAGSVGSTDGTGSAARFNLPHKLTTDGTNLFVAEYGNHTIRKVVIATGVVTTLAGSAGSVGSTDGTGSAARFNNPVGITTDGTNLYVSDYANATIRKIQ